MTPNSATAERLDKLASINAAILLSSPVLALIIFVLGVAAGASQ